MCAVHCDASQLSGQIEHTLQSYALPRFQNENETASPLVLSPRFSPQSVTLGRHKGHILNKRTGFTVHRISEGLDQDPGAGVIIFVCHIRGSCQSLVGRSSSLLFCLG